VLLAEDNDVNALVALKALEKLGALVDWARDGREALAKAAAAIAGETLAYDVILMDVRMPGLDGMEVTRRIRAGEARRGRIAHPNHRPHGQRGRHGRRSGADARV
jgi:CheY-like chemotaxis protein